MVLLVEGQPVDPESLLDHPKVQAAAAAFLRQPAAAGAAVQPATPTGRKLVYACQGEEASCRADEDVVLCSSDATTCVCVVVVPLPAGPTAPAPAEAGQAGQHAAGQPSTSGQLARVAHHDTSTALRSTVAGLGQRGALVWMVGAYADSRGTGAQVAGRLLRFLGRSAALLEVRLACLGRLNTAADGSPLATALSVDLRTLAAWPAAPDPLHLRGPLLPARMAQWAYSWPGGGSGSSNDGSEGDSGGSSGGSESGDGESASRLTHRLRSIYNAALGRLELRLEQGRPPAQILQYARLMGNLPDELLLQHCSTSPLHEPPHFVAGLKHAECTVAGGRCEEQGWS